MSDVLAMLEALPPDERDRLTADTLAATANLAWIPSPGPQTEAYLSPADLLLYGGQGGGGKSDLLLGTALTNHRLSLIMRRQYTDLGALTERACEIRGTRNGFSGGSPPRMRTDDGRLIEFGAAAMPGDEQSWMGRAHDLLGIDEAAHFLESQVRLLMGWVRSASPGQRCRTIFATNPPLSAEGQWLIGMFRPWLDVTHANPAKPGELRWFITDPDGNDLEVDGPDDCREWKGDVYRPKSRTFVPAALKDNPFLASSGYQSTLDAMPEPMRSAVRDGNFMASREDDAWQIIPTGWVMMANERWRKGKPSLFKMTAAGLDVARGGKDETVLSVRWDKWFAELVCVPGRQTPDGPSVAALVAGQIRDRAPVGVDSIGVGGAAEDALGNAGIAFEGINGSSRSHRATRDGSFGFVNKRAEVWWMLREALDPAYGVEIALPPDIKLQADLTAPRYSVRVGAPPKIYVESKEDIIRRLGRSPDRGDAVAYCWAVDVEAILRKRLRDSVPRPTHANSAYRPHHWRR